MTLVCRTHSFKLQGRYGFDALRANEVKPLLEKRKQALDAESEANRRAREDQTTEGRQRAAAREKKAAERTQAEQFISRFDSSFSGWTEEDYSKFFASWKPTIGEMGCFNCGKESTTLALVSDEEGYVDLKPACSDCAELIGFMAQNGKPPIQTFGFYEAFRDVLQERLDRLVQANQEFALLVKYYGQFLEKLGRKYTTEEIKAQIEKLTPEARAKFQEKALSAEFADPMAT
jgi:hypothetical protein